MTVAPHPERRPATPTLPTLPTLPAPPAPPAPPVPSGRVPALDGLRGLAILMVVVHHFISLSHTAGRAAAVVASVTGSLWCGVDLFFVLSGFLVTRVLIGSPRGPGFLRTFYIRRFLRVCPLYYLVLGVGLTLAAAGHVPPHLGLPGRPAEYGPLLLYLTNFWTLVNRSESGGPLFVFWSLAVEEHFYLVWPFAVLALTRVGLLAACGAVALVAAGCRAALIHRHAPPMAVYSVTFCRADTLAVGAALALLIRPGVDVAACRRWAHVGAVAALALLVGLLWWSGQTRLNSVDPTFQTFGYPLVAGLMGCLLTIAVVGPPGHPLVRLCLAPALQWLGLYSYGIYVFHTMCLDWVIYRLTPPATAGLLRAAGFALLRPAVGMTLSVGLAWLSYHLLERHMLRLKDVLAPVRRPTPRTPSSVPASPAPRSARDASS